MKQSMASSETIINKIFWLIIALNLMIVDIDCSVDMLFVILSQTNAYHANKANILKQSLIHQTIFLGSSEPSVLLTHEKWPNAVGLWTILPLVTPLFHEYCDKKSSIFFCEDDLDINLSLLLKKLEKEDFQKELFLGRALRDREATIIHHFAFHENPSSFAYPDFAAGFIISCPLLKRISDRLKNSTPSLDFSIDAQHELALYIWNNGKGVALTEATYLCGSSSSADCATQHRQMFTNCGDSLNVSDIFFAVKTCKKFHEERLSVVMKTWGVHAKKIEYFSDVADSSIPTISLGIPNTERGHCSKFIAILKYVYDQFQTMAHYKWLVVVDDDTLLSVSRLKKLLSCHNPQENVALGERYGYGVVKGTGYDYITLGGGMALSESALREFIESDACHCSSDDAPDDMTFGICLKHLNIPITHSSRFHQARPIDYSEEYLSNQLPISFHRHWMINPYQVYREWLTNHEEDDNDDILHDDKFIRSEL